MTSNRIKESKSFLLDSRNAVVSFDSSSNTNLFTFSIPDMYHWDSSTLYTTLSLKRACFFVEPNNVDESNNCLSVVVGGTAYTLNLQYGYYTTQTLLRAINSFFYNVCKLTLNFEYLPYTRRIQAVSSLNIQWNTSLCTMFPLLGFQTISAFAPLSISGSSWNCTGQAFPLIEVGNFSLYVCLDDIYNENYSTMLNRNYFRRLPLPKEAGLFMEYKGDKSDESYFPLKDDVNSITVKLYNDNGNGYDNSNGIPWQLELSVNSYKAAPMDSDSDFRSYLAALQASSSA